MPETLEFVGVGEMDDQPAATSGGLLDLDFGAERDSKLLFKRRNLAGLGSLTADFCGRERDCIRLDVLNVIADRLFCISNAQPLGLDALTEIA